MALLSRYSNGVPRKEIHQVHSPPGYWLQQGWPTFNDTDKRTHWSPALTGQPQLGRSQLRFPILVSFFEHMQKEEFWTVVMIGLSLDALKVSMIAIEGTQTNLEVFPNTDRVEIGNRG